MKRYKRFKILQSVGDAYRFAGREWAYLLKIGVVPMVLHVVTGLFLQFYRPEASLAEGFLWALPVTFLFGIFNFAQMRLLLLGERLDRLTPQEVYAEGRPRMMQASVFLFVLFHMFISGNALVLSLLMPSGSSESMGATVLVAFIIGMLFWGVRLGVLPILAAVGYPLRRFLQQVTSPFFSLHLVLMGIAAVMPIGMLLQVVGALVLSPSGVSTLEAGLPVQTRITLTLLGAPFVLAVHVLLNAAAAYALKQMLQEEEG